MAATLITGVVLANNNANISMTDMHQAHHQENGMGMMSMHNMMNNVDMTAMHEQCESSMDEQTHQQCESMMDSGACPMMQ